ncbi:MAG TPA: DegT/DnrJ/EryC1/StrS family aminotransferase [Aggregatilineales bacterium]|nr:DegT/DnrJ/EryC1/StrS family aminotransferase [Aggregatilineales bacterium]HPV07017.1 DegT/DnrJ/EryC1/StrS family aminotransferase [Aggregatilineales bacterium]HQA66684.1 DegT/DnrJ/EryC1/StrS family aminotransferase [Aggregatilineales bacterium]HQE17866.1 DegT/DnrJ/EryC1/StrS family aminotransferase [Aggregatilineales bacterium]
MAAIPLVDLRAQYVTIKDEIDAAIARVLETTSFIGGNEVRGFEEAFARYQGVEHMVGVGSGTAALYLALAALGIGPGDEVITQANTFFATVEAIIQVGATPVLVDIDPRTYSIDPAQVEVAITPATRAIIPVHMYGQLAPMDRIMEIARRHGLKVIEDAAQAHGAEYRGRRAGQWGDAACFSFYPGKNLGAYGDGGAVGTNDAAIAERLRLLRNHGSEVKYRHEMVGVCERLDALQAAVLSVKLPYLDAWNEARRQKAAYYSAALAGTGIVTPAAHEGSTPVYHIYCVRVPGDRDSVLRALDERGIGAGVHYPTPVHLQPAMAGRGWAEGDFPHTEAAARSILSLPIYAELTERQMDEVIMALGEAVGVPV